MGAERREQRRIQVRIDTYCKGTARAGMGQVSNLSGGGCRLTSTVPLATGDQVVLTLYFGPTGSMTLLGRVVSIGSKGFGLKFENMTPSIKYELREILESLVYA